MTHPTGAAAPERTIWWHGDRVAVIDQTALPHELRVQQWATVDDAAAGIEQMVVRGAPLIGVAAAHGVALGVAVAGSDLDAVIERLARTRPTAVNLRWALDHMRETLDLVPTAQRRAVARAAAQRLADDDVETCRQIGEAGLGLFRAVLDSRPKRGRPLQVMTHCNAGWLACVEWGTATAPIYLAHESGIDVHVWVSETRPRNQGASLTAWELGARGVPHTVIVDNAAGHVLQEGLVDLCIVGTDRVAANGDVANKIGTYLKALACHANGVPFYVAAPTSSIDAATATGSDIPIEERSPSEVLELAGSPIVPAGTTARNWGFDVTPAQLVRALITERGVVDASPDGVTRALVGRVSR